MCGPVRLDYPGLRALVGRIGRDLEGRGARPGDRGAAVFPNFPPVLTGGNLGAHVDMTLQELGFSARDAWLHAAPMFHLADAWAVWTVTAAGGTHVLLPRFEPAAALELMCGAGVTITNLVPTMLMGLLAEAQKHGRAPRSLRLLLSGGAPIAPSVVARIGERLGCDYAH